MNLPAKVAVDLLFMTVAALAGAIGGAVAAAVVTRGLTKNTHQGPVPVT